MQIENTIIYLIGYPAVGKFTIAKQICNIIGAKLVDNHKISNPILSVIKTDGGITPIQETVWDKVAEVRNIVFDVITNISPPEISFVLTNVLFKENDDEITFRKLEDVSIKRNSLFVPVILTCDKEEMCRRVVSLERVNNYKLTNIERMCSLLENKSILPIKHKNLLELDTTQLPAEESANIIIKHIINLSYG